ncbi:unnamed protein product [Caenorhabditis nigoni]
MFLTIPVKGLSEAVSGLTGGVNNVLNGTGCQAFVAELVNGLVKGLQTGTLTPGDVVRVIKNLITGLVAAVMTTITALLATEGILNEI